MQIELLTAIDSSNFQFPSTTLSIHIVTMDCFKSASNIPPRFRHIAPATLSPCTFTFDSMIWKRQHSDAMLVIRQKSHFSNKNTICALPQYDILFHLPVFFSLPSLQFRCISHIFHICHCVWIGLAAMDVKKNQNQNGKKERENYGRRCVLRCCYCYCWYAMNTLANGKNWNENNNNNKNEKRRTHTHIERERGNTTTCLIVPVNIIPRHREFESKSIDIILCIHTHTHTV